MAGTGTAGPLEPELRGALFFCTCRSEMQLSSFGMFSHGWICGQPRVFSGFLDNSHELPLLPGARVLGCSQIALLWCDRRRPSAAPGRRRPPHQPREASVFGLLTVALALPVVVCGLPVVPRLVPVQAARWSWRLMYPFGVLLVPLMWRYSACK